MKPIKKSKMYGGGLLLYILIVIAIVNFGCGSRKKELHEVKTQKETVKQQENTAQVNQSVKTTDNTTTVEKSITEAKTSQNDTTEIEADSVVTTERPDGSKKTTIYTKPGTKIRNVSNKQAHTNTEASKDVKADVITDSKRDSTGKQSQSEHTKQDSSIKDLKTDRKGPGTTYAYTIPFTIGAIVIIALLLYFLWYKKK